MSKNDFDSVKCYQCGSLFSSIDEPSTCDSEEVRVGKFQTFVDLYVNELFVNLVWLALLIIFYFIPVRYLANLNIYFKHTISTGLIK